MRITIKDTMRTEYTASRIIIDANIPADDGVGNPEK